MKNKRSEVFNLPSREIEVDPDLRYGFAYTTSRIGTWFAYIGSFPYLYGVFGGVFGMEEFLVEKRDFEESEYQAYAFFDLDGDLNPLNLIDRARIPPGLTSHVGSISSDPKKHGMVVRDLVIIIGNPPPFNGEF